MCLLDYVADQGQVPFYVPGNPDAIFYFYGHRYDPYIIIPEWYSFEAQGCCSVTLLGETKRGSNLISQSKKCVSMSENGWCATFFQGPVVLQLSDVDCSELIEKDKQRKRDIRNMRNAASASGRDPVVGEERGNEPIQEESYGSDEDTILGGRVSS